MTHPFGEDLPRPEVQTFRLPELAASKLIALVRRSVPRDLFDVAMLSQVAEADIELLRTVVVVRGASYPPPAPDSYDPRTVERVRLTSWKSEVVALARRPLPIDVDEAKRRASDLLQAVSQLREEQKEFLKALETGEIRADHLDLPDPSRVLMNPGLLWRLKVGVEALEER